MTSCTFCQIAKGALPAEIVYDQEGCIAFLDSKPLFAGHVLLIPREHAVTYMELPSDLLPRFFRAGQKLATAVQSAMGAEGVFVAMNNRVSQSVPHLHMHIVPRTKGDGLKGFFWPRTKYKSAEHAAETAASIKKALAEASAL